MKRRSGSTVKSASVSPGGHFRIPGTIAEATKWQFPCEVLVEWDADMGAIILRRIEDATFRISKKVRGPKGGD